MDTNTLLTRVISRNQVAGAYLNYKSKYYKIKTSVATGRYIRVETVSSASLTQMTH